MRLNRKKWLMHLFLYRLSSLQWHHNEHNDVSIHRRLGGLLNPLFRRRSKKTLKLCATGLCEGNPPVTSRFPPQRASNAENVSVWWLHHGHCPFQPALSASVTMDTTLSQPQLTSAGHEGHSNLEAMVIQSKYKSISPINILFRLRYC